MPKLMLTDTFQGDTSLILFSYFFMDGHIAWDFSEHFLNNCQGAATANAGGGVGDKHILCHGQSSVLQVNLNYHLVPLSPCPPLLQPDIL